MPDIDLANLTDAEHSALGDLVHDVASEAASNAINAGDGVQFLLSNGWTEERIRDRLAELTDDH